MGLIFADATFLLHPKWSNEYAGNRQEVKIKRILCILALPFVVIAELLKLTK